MPTCLDVPPDALKLPFVKSASKLNTSRQIRHRISCADNATFQDICRCLVGVWPTHIDQHWRRDDLLQAVVDGVLQPMPPSESSTEGADEDAAPTSGGGDGNNGASELDPAATAPPAGLCTGVVFRGPIGGDRAVRANVPFPFLGTMLRSPSTKLTDKDFARGCVVTTSRLSDPDVYTSQWQFPDEFLARVKEDAPFATLWPGHAAGRGKHAEGLPATAAATGDGDAGVSGGAASAAAASGGGGGGMKRDLRRELEQLPSSGPAPFFHAGYTAYFEITLGETVAPLERQEHGVVGLECVAIGLANERFQLRWGRSSVFSRVRRLSPCVLVFYVLSLVVFIVRVSAARGLRFDRVRFAWFVPVW